MLVFVKLLHDIEKGITLTYSVLEVIVILIPTGEGPNRKTKPQVNLHNEQRFKNYQEETAK